MKTVKIDELKLLTDPIEKKVYLLISFTLEDVREALKQLTLKDFEEEENDNSQ